MTFQPCVYIMANKPRGLPYIGVTSDLMQRVYQHRARIADGFTKRYNLNKLVLFEQYGTMELAITREKQLKRWHREWKLNLIEASNPLWRDLAEDLEFESVRQ